jgi:polysaccharide deacetylase 2 family uncharacterized protein YibQ
MPMKCEEGKKSKRIRCMKSKAKRKNRRPFPWGFFAFLAVVVFIAAFFHAYFKESQRKALLRKPAVKTTGSTMKTPRPSDSATAPPPTPAATEVPMSSKAPRPTPVEPGVAIIRPGTPLTGERKIRAAIIVDDFGNNLALGEEFVKLPAHLNIAILPCLPYSRTLSEKAAASGKTVMLHLPMEPKGGADPGPGIIRTSMSRDEIRSVIKKNLETVPGAEGFNNHEGSKATSDEAVMKAVLEYAKERRLFFADSLTSGATRGRAVAGKIGIPFAVRDLFLDNADDETYVRERLRLLREEAKKRGSVVGICHVKKGTLAALQEDIHLFQEEGIALVSIKDLLR